MAEDDWPTMSLDDEAEARNQLGWLQRERDSRRARGVAVPGWVDRGIEHISLDLRRAEHDRIAGPMRPREWRLMPWWGWCLFAVFWLAVLAGAISTFGAKP